MCILPIILWQNHESHELQSIRPERDSVITVHRIVYWDWRIQWRQWATMRTQTDENEVEISRRRKFFRTNKIKKKHAPKMNSRGTSQKETREFVCSPKFIFVVQAFNDSQAHRLKCTLLYSVYSVCGSDSGSERARVHSTHSTPNENEIDLPAVNGNSSRTEPRKTERKK